MQLTVIMGGAIRKKSLTAYATNLFPFRLKRNAFQVGGYAMDLLIVKTD